MSKALNYLIITFLVFFLCACSTWDKLDNKERGAVIGGTSGALIGNAAGGGAGGTILGGAAGAVGGGLIGREMDKDDDDN
ncbi:MAG: hypothetical protein KDD56_02285 [Bdellovibrionales bacterium]|nr:hypothetical protein [Bdellovibrionales bacterium]